MSLDGRIATAAGESQWISSPRARRWALALREEHDATLVGSGTALADDPRLDRRLGLAGKAGLRAVLDRRLRLAAWAAAAPPATPRRLFTVADPLLIYTSAVTIAAAGAAGQLPRLPGNVEVVALPAVEPAAVLADLYARGARSVLVEGGAEVLASFAASGLYDRVAAVCAPLIIGGRNAPGPLAGAGAATLAEAPRLDHLHALRRGGDHIVEALRQGLLEQLLARLQG
jgi:diaminohydroxyphosphoribosylaminopyrimidine deaminase/5-amino-6-(5-phosphoribosylamino)uracil reductase